MSSLRKNIAVIPQDTMLFNASIYENIKYGRLDASDEDIRKSVEQAFLNDFIESLPKGWDTIVGERGLKLSGGEKQRIAIARAILKNPPIFIFDEIVDSIRVPNPYTIGVRIDEDNQIIYDRKRSGLAPLKINNFKN